MGKESSKSIQKSEEVHGHVVLPVSKSDFTDFIKSLLGKPQSIRKLISGVFEVDKHSIGNLYELLDQRISQQNQGNLIQFTAKIMFSDDSSVQLNSLVEFMTYNEVRPVISIAIHLSFDYLVKFEDKNIPERQQIQVSFAAAHQRKTYFDREIPIMISGPSEGFIDFNIQHTARTWAADIESLLTNFAESIMKSSSRFQKFVSKHSTKISLSVSILFFLASLTGTFIATWRFAETKTRELGAFLAQNNSLSQESINAKIEFIASSLTSGIWAQHYFKIFIFLLISFVLAIILGIWVDNGADNQESSFVLLTKKSFESKENVIRKYNRKWKVFILSIVVSIGCGVVANYVFFMFKG